MPIEQPVPLQSDVVSAGPSIRTITVMLLINGVPTPVVMQAMSVADADGRIFDNETFANRELLGSLWKELREIRKILALQNGVPVPGDRDDYPTML